MNSSNRRRWTLLRSIVLVGAAGLMLFGRASMLGAAAVHGGAHDGTTARTGAEPGHADESGIVWAWGNNRDGELGLGTTASTALPLIIHGLRDVIGVSAGGGAATMAVAERSGNARAVRAEGATAVAGPARERAREVILGATRKGTPATGGAPTIIANGLHKPWGVTVDAHGTLYITDYDNNRVVKVPAGGAPTTVVSGLGGPVGVAVDAHGTLYIADAGNTQVVKVPAGSGVQ